MNATNTVVLTAKADLQAMEHVRLMDELLGGAVKSNEYLAAENTDLHREVRRLREQLATRPDGYRGRYHLAMAGASVLFASWVAYAVWLAVR